MLQKIHEHIKGWVAALVMGVVGLTFALWGVQYYVNADRKEGRVLAEVGRQKITEQQVDLLSRQMQRQVAANGTIVDDTVQQTLRQVALENLVIEKALTSAAYSDGFMFNAEQAKQVVMQVPAFQENGQFSMEKFNRFLYQSDLNETQFLNALQSNLVMATVRHGIQESSFSLPDDARVRYGLLHQQRSFGYLVVPAHRFYKPKTVTEDQIKTFYAHNRERFRSLERVSIEYVQLSPKADANKAEQLENVAFTNPDSLAPVASALGLPIQTSDTFSREGAPKGIAADSEVVTAAFSPEVLQGNNSPPIILKDGAMIVLRVKSHQKRTVLPLEIVREKVRAQVAQQWAQAKAALLANELEKKIQLGASPEKIAIQNQLVWVYKDRLSRTVSPKLVAPTILEAVFDLSLSTGKNITTVALENGDTVLVRLDHVYPADFGHLSSKDQRLFERGLAQWDGQLSYALYMASVKNKTTIKVLNAVGSSSST